MFKTVLVPIVFRLEEKSSTIYIHTLSKNSVLTNYVRLSTQLFLFLFSFPTYSICLSTIFRPFGYLHLLKVEETKKRERGRFLFLFFLTRPLSIIADVSLRDWNGFAAADFDGGDRRRSW